MKKSFKKALIAVICANALSIAATESHANNPVESNTTSYETTQIDPTDKKYINTTTTFIKGQTLNYEMPIKGLRVVSVRAKELVIENGNQNGFYSKYHNAKDIKALNIYADRIIVKSPLSVHQANITIYARELIFDDTKGYTYISTTPASKSESPEQFKDGVDGLKGGDLNVYVNYIDTQDSQPRFISFGGNGQPGGQGQEGADGTSVPVIEGTRGSKWCDNHNFTASQGVTYFDCLWVKIYGNARVFPTNGGDGIRGGIPGSPGFVGNISGTSNVLAYVSTKPGTPGRETPSYKGGRAGTPTKVYHAYSNTSPSNTWNGIPGGPNAAGLIVDQVVTRRLVTTTSDGSPSSKVQANRLVASGGEVSQNNTSWLHPEIFKVNLQIAKDLYLQGKYSETERVLVALISEYERHFNSTDYSNVGSNAKMQNEIFMNSAKALRFQLSNHIDYFGNPAAWTPLLSFEINKSLFEHEVSNSVDVMYLAYWLENAHASLEEKKQALESAKKKIVESLLSYAKEIEESRKAIPSLNMSMEKLSNDQKAFDALLVDVEKRLEERARNNVEDRLKVPEWKKMVKVASAASKVIPAYQPALAAVGKGMEMISNAKTDKPLTEISNIKSYLEKNKESFDWEKSLVNWNEYKKEIDLNKFGNMSGEDRLKKVDALGGKINEIQNGLENYRQAFKEKEAPASEIAIELEKLKKENTEFKELAEQVENIQAQRISISSELNQMMANIQSLLLKTQEGLAAIHMISYGIDESYEGLDHNAMAYLSNIKENAEQRLLEYHFNMARAYYYRTLKPYAGKLDLTELYHRFKNVVEISNSQSEKTPALSAEDFKNLKTVYTNQISSLVKDLYDFMENSVQERSISKVFKLTTSQIELINKGGTVVLEPEFNNNEYSVRVRDIKVDYEVDYKEDEYDNTQFATLDFNVTHSGRAKINSFGNEIPFVYYRDENKTRYRWSTRYDLVGDKFERDTLSAASESLIASMLPNNSNNSNNSSNQEIMKYSRPGARAKFLINTQVNTNNNSIELKVKHRSVKITIEYDKVEI